MESSRAIVGQVRTEVVGRDDELEVVVAALASGRNVLVEGPPGVGKSTMLRAVARAAGVGFLFVEGNAELTPPRLLGAHDPALVIERGYGPHTFISGPLAHAVTEGCLLYLEEFNRIPEETLNLLVTVLAEREVHVPRVGRLEAAPSFRCVGTMNPHDEIGTARVSEAVADRSCRIRLDYQDEAAERAIVAANAPNADSVLLRRAVAATRASRSHPELARGCSVRGAIDLMHVAHELGSLLDGRAGAHDVGKRAARAALTGRVRLHVGSNRTVEEVVDELWARACAGDGPSAGTPDDQDPTGGQGPGKAPATV